MSTITTRSFRKPSGERTDIRLVRDCVAGQEEAWFALVEKYKALIYSIPVKYGLPSHEAADIFQMVCMELLARLPDLREVRALPKWLMQVTHHECHRAKRRRQRLISRDGDADLPEPEVPAMAESLVLQVQEEQFLREAIATLAPQCQKLVFALFFEAPARPYAEIAAELGLAVGSIGFTRQKCIERLRVSLQKMGFR
jgi:RNA polymerase sigma factor (sigma-70 family)